MPGQHKVKKAITYRPATEDDLRRLLDFAARVGKDVTAVIRTAVSEYLDRNEDTKEQQR